MRKTTGRDAGLPLKDQTERSRNTLGIHPARAMAMINSGRSSGLSAQAAGE